MLGRVLCLAVATVIFSAVTDAADWAESMSAGVASCQQRFPIPSDQLQSFMETRLLKDDSNEAATCFVQCVLEGLGAVNRDSGSMIVQNMQKVTEDYFRGKKKADGTMVNVDILKKNVEDCNASETGNIACQRNYRIWRCMQMRGAKEMMIA